MVYLKNKYYRNYCDLCLILMLLKGRPFQEGTTSCVKRCPVNTKNVCVTK